MSASRFEQYKSFFSDRYQFAKSQVTKFVESEPVQQVKQSLNKQLDNCTTVIADQYQKVAHSDTVQSCTSTVSKALESNVGIHLSQQYNKTKCQLIEIAESDTTLKTRSVIEGAVEATLGVHYLFSLGLKCIPLNSSLFLTLELMKYAVTGFTFAVASYKTFDDLTSQKNILDSLEDEINIANTSFQQAKTDFASEHPSASPVANIDYKKLKINIAQPANQSLLNNVTCSTTFLMVKSFLDAAVKSIGYLYIVEAGACLLPCSNRTSMLRHILLWTIISANMVSAYLRNESKVNTKLKRIDLENKIEPTYAKLLEIEQKLGSKEKLKMIAKQMESIMQQQIELDIPKYRIEEVRSMISVLSEKDPATYISSFIHGAALASGIHFILETTFPSLVAMKYIASISTLLSVTYTSYSENKDYNHFLEKLKKLTAKNQDVQDSLIISRQLNSYVKNHGLFKTHSGEVGSPETEVCHSRPG